MINDPCECGKKIKFLEANPIGIQRDSDGNPIISLFNCDCGTTRSVMWRDDPDHAQWIFQTRAILAEQERLRGLI